MRIGIHTWGSYGDVRPFLALADGLQSAGHQVSLCVTEITDYIDYRKSESISDFDVDVVRTSYLRDAIQIKKNPKNIFREKNPFKEIRALFSELFLPDVEEMYRASEQLCKENDLVVGTSFHYPLLVASEKSGTPAVCVALAHYNLPMLDCPPPGFMDLGSWGNPFLWRLEHGIVNHVVKPYINQLRIQHGLAPMRRVSVGTWENCWLTLVAVSPQICKPQACWPKSVRVCGFLDMPNPSFEGTIDPGLERFLASGDPPIYMGFGSMTSSIPDAQQKMIQLFEEAAKLAGCRAIIQAPNWESLKRTPSEAIYFIKTAPHHLVFPYCGAVVHHGGAGTTQTTTLAGKPSVVVAHLREQRFWGSELQRLGIATKPLMSRDVTPIKLAERIKKVIETPALRLKAEAIAKSMELENGVAQAVKLIQQKFPSGVQTRS